MLQERFISLLPVEKVENLNLFLPDMHIYAKFGTFFVGRLP